MGSLILHMLSTSEWNGHQHAVGAAFTGKATSEDRDPMLGTACTSCHRQLSNCDDMNLRKRQHVLRYAPVQCCSPHAFVGEQLPKPSNPEMLPFKGQTSCTASGAPYVRHQSIHPKHARCAGFGADPAEGRDTDDVKAGSRHCLSSCPGRRASYQDTVLPEECWVGHPRALYVHAIVFHATRNTGASPPAQLLPS